VERCGVCGRSALESTISPQSWTVGDRTFFAKLRVSSCKSCGQVFGLIEGRIELGLRAAGEFVRAGDFTGDAMKHMRRVLGLKAAEWARVIGVTPDTISRWETGKRPLPRSAAFVLGSLVMDQLEGRGNTLQYLKALRAPRKLPQHIELGTLGTR
jgi:hypothetical protein